MVSNNNEKSAIFASVKIVVHILASKSDLFSDLKNKNTV